MYSRFFHFGFILTLAAVVLTACGPAKSIPSATRVPQPAGTLQPYAAAVPTATAEAARTSPDVAGKELFTSDFSTPLAAWDEQVGDDESAQYHSGGYQIRLSRPKQQASRLLGVKAKDIAIRYQYNESVSQIQSGNGAFAGAYCRYQDSYNYYALGIFVTSEAGNAYYGIGRVVKGGFQWVARTFVPNFSGAERISKAGSSEAITVDGETQYLNTFEARCVGNRLSIYRNGLLFLTANDDTFDSGDAGVGLWAGQTAGKDAALWQITRVSASDLSAEASKDSLEWRLAEGQEYVIDHIGSLKSFVLMKG